MLCALVEPLPMFMKVVLNYGRFDFGKRRGSLPLARNATPPDQTFELFVS